MSWAEVKKAINSTIGTANAKPLNEIFEDFFTERNIEKGIIITENGEHSASAGYIGMNDIIVNVDAPEPSLQEKTVLPSNDEKVIVADEGYDGLGRVIVYPAPIEFGKSVTQNGYYLAGEGYIGMQNIHVNVPDSPLPIEIATENEMTAILTNATADSVGAVYKYTGTTGTYENGALYVVEKEVPTGYTVTLKTNSQTDRPIRYKINGESEWVTPFTSPYESKSVTIPNVYEIIVDIYVEDVTIGNITINGVDIEEVTGYYAYETPTINIGQDTTIICEACG